MNELELFRLLKEYALALDIETTLTYKMRCDDATSEVKTCCSFDSYGAESFCTGENNKLLEVLRPCSATFQFDHMRIILDSANRLLSK